MDDTKVHRGDPHVWGTCTFHEYTARCPNRATTVRAHNWVALGALLEDPGKPACYLPITGRLYFRASQLPPRQGMSGPTVEFRTKCELAVELIRQQARLARGKHLAIFDGAFALRSVVRPLALPGPGAPRVEFLTRLRHDARLCAVPPAERPKGKRGASRCGAPRCRRRGRGATGAGRGAPARRSSTAGSGRSAGRRSSACGGSWGMRCRSRRWSPTSRATRSGSPW